MKIYRCRIENERMCGLAGLDDIDLATNGEYIAQTIDNKGWQSDYFKIKVIAQETRRYFNDYFVLLPKIVSYKTDSNANIKREEVKEIEEMKENKSKNPIEKVWFNEQKGTTVVKWTDGTKTKVKLAEDDVFDEEKGILACFMKHYCGDTGKFNDYIDATLDDAERYIAKETKENVVVDNFSRIWNRDAVEGMDGLNTNLWDELKVFVILWKERRNKL